MNKNKKRKRAKNPKVVLPRKQVFILTAAIVAVCVCMLCITILTAPSGTPETASSSPEDSAVVQEQKNVSEYITQVIPPPVALPESSVLPASKGPSEPKPKASPEPELNVQPRSAIPEEKPAVIPPAVTEYDRIPQAAAKSVLVFVFDDGGQNTEQLQPFLNLPFPVSIAVMPGLPYSAESANRIRAAGKEVLLHQPMQAKNLNVNPGPGAIEPGMSPADIRNLLLANLQKIGPAAGLNNHEGSLITESAEQMGAVLDVCLSEGIFFLDSRTTADTKAPAAAAARGMHIWERDIFLDNTPNRQDILDQLYRGLAVANRKGYAILIGHVWSPQLATILNELYPVLKRKGYTFSVIRGLYEDFGN